MNSWIVRFRDGAEISISAETIAILHDRGWVEFSGPGEQLKGLVNCIEIASIVKAEDD